MRERLIELLEEAYNGYLIDDTRAEREKLADYLLKNGVVVLPCMVGTKVYKIVPKCNRKMCPCDGYVMNETLRCRKGLCEAYIEEVPFKVELLDYIGKTIFITKEEAEAALAKENQQ